ncbi:MAG: histone family protein DNA-binding protein [Candidatus Parvibacillus calidus]|nr:MAG: histone family protein DNA-binding protein [Candidatus Parvibacillus calidus]
MNKGDLINKIADSAKITKTQAGNALDATIKAISSSLKKGDKVTLIGFGTFSVSKRSARLVETLRLAKKSKLLLRKLQDSSQVRALLIQLLPVSNQKTLKEIKGRSARVALFFLQ